MKRSYYEQLLERFKALDQTAVAFSGGVDSSLLAYAAHEALGDRMLAITVCTPYIPDWEIAEARLFAAKYHIAHEIIELAIPTDITFNPADRCYLCKKALFKAIRSRATEIGIHTVIEGSNKDDLNDYRPGMRALKELGIISPLLEAGMSKEAVRAISRQAGLATWDKPAYACLLSRIPYHTEITVRELERIARAETVLRDLQIFGARVRSHGDIARVEVPAALFSTLLQSELRTVIVTKIKNCGYKYITLDLEGYKMGSLNHLLSPNHE